MRQDLKILRPRGMLAAALLGAALLSLQATEAQAVPITDPVGDFLPSYVGPLNSNMDVVSANAVYDGTTYHLFGTVAGPIGATTTGFYIFGFNRGAGTVGFPSLAPGVTFDAVAIVTVAGTARTVVNGVTTNLPTSAFHIAGNAVTLDVPAALLPSTGFTPDSYLVNLWTRSNGGNINLIPDFAPDNSDFGVSVPEPTSLALLGLGLAGLTFSRRRKSVQA